MTSTSMKQKFNHAFCIIYNLLSLIYVHKIEIIFSIQYFYLSAGCFSGIEHYFEKTLNITVNTSSNLINQIWNLILIILIYSFFDKIFVILIIKKELLE